MIRLLVIFALSIAAPAYATDFAQAGVEKDGFYIVLTKEPCPADMLANVKPELQERFQFAKEWFQGREIRACWALNPPVVMIFDEEGDQGSMPMSEFRPVQGI